jgi:prevent-host-death family protein
MATMEPPLSINVRAAKDQLSSLLEEAARGNEVIITSDGLPKAKLVPFREARKPFRVDWELLRSTPMKADGKLADELVREDRDARP